MMTEEQKRKQKERIALNRLLKIIDGEIEPNPPQRLITISNNAVVLISDDKNNQNYEVEMEYVYIDLNVGRGRIIIHGRQTNGEQFMYSEHLHECKFTGTKSFPKKDLRMFSYKDKWICVIKGKENSTTMELSQYFLETRKIVK